MSLILEFVHKIVICCSSYIILQINLSFVVVPSLEYDRFKCYKLLFYRLWEFPHFKNRSVKFRFQLFQNHEFLTPNSR
ncbi:hypothetical protein A6J42_17135 [Leptospira interrogans serovar Copenhageni]|nr:hypothetical protein A6J42_17135 [Leptospira interrogans serovar Copenhageni]ASP41767.1 hypothetical protein AMR47_07665 [Leptospira interrogans]